MYVVRLIVVFTQCVSIRATARCVTSYTGIGHFFWRTVHMDTDVSENLLPSSSVQKGHNFKAILYQTARRYIAPGFAYCICRCQGILLPVFALKGS